MGRHGLEQRFELQTRARGLEKELARLEVRRLESERNVRLLTAGAIDPDMLDEQARRQLGFARPDEIVVVFEHTRRR